MPAFDLPHVGRLGVGADRIAPPSRYNRGVQAHSDWEPSRSRPGDVGWADLAVSDLERAAGFYGELFGWRLQRTDGPHGYHTLMAKDVPVAGIFENGPAMPRGAWTFYVNVDDTNVVCEAAKAAGGRVLANEVLTGVVHFAVLADPQGARLGVAKSLR